MKILYEKNYGIPTYRDIAIVTNTKPTWKDSIKFRFRMAKLYVKRMFGLLK